MPLLGSCLEQKLFVSEDKKKIMGNTRVRTRVSAYMKSVLRWIPHLAVESKGSVITTRPCYLLVSQYFGIKHK